MEIPPPLTSFFKIVQTREAGKCKPSLSLVPSAFEKNGILYWPQNLNTTDMVKIIKDANSVPQAGWLELPAKVKRTSIPTWKIGSKILKDMMAQSDTSNTENEDIEDKKSRHVRRALLNNFPPKNDYTQMMVCIYMFRKYNYVNYTVVLFVG